MKRSYIFHNFEKKQIYCDCCKTHKISSHKIFTRENIIVQLVLKLQQEELARSRGRYKGNWRIWSHNRSLLFSVIIASFILDDCCRHEYAEGKFLLFDSFFTQITCYFPSKAFTVVHKYFRFFYSFKFKYHILKNMHILEHIWLFNLINWIFQVFVLKRN